MAALDRNVRFVRSEAHERARHQQILWMLALSAGIAVATIRLPAASAVQAPSASRPTTADRPCKASGVVTSGPTPLPGASVIVKNADKVVAVTSTDLDGSFVVSLAPGTYAVHIELTAFASADRSLTLALPSCDTILNANMSLATRVLGAGTVAAPIPSALASSQPQAGSSAGARGGRGSGRFAGPPRFQALSVNESEVPPATTDAVLGVTAPNGADDPATRLLPPGFSLDASSESIAVSGSMVTLDRTVLAARLDALQRGEFGLAEGTQFGVQNAIGSEGPFGDSGGGGAGGRGAGQGPGGRGGFPGGVIGGRGVGANRIQVNTAYGLGGSALDAAPYALRGEAPQQRDYLQQNFSTTIGGAVKIPHLYDGTRRTTFNLSYSGARNGDLFDQYATVPSDAFRSGDFSSGLISIIDPTSGQPFPGNRIPASRLDPTALALLQYIPTPTLSGDAENYRHIATSQSNTDTISLRLTHSFTSPPANAGRGGRGGAGGFGGGRGGGGGAAGATGRPGGAGGQAAGRGGPGGRGNFQPPLNVTMNATLNYRRNAGDRLNVFPQLDGSTTGSNVSLPVAVNVRAGRSIHVFNFSINRTASTTLGPFAFSQDIAGSAGITGVSADPFDWGVPNLSFGSLTGVRDVAPSRRVDRSFRIGYTWTRPVGTHTYRMGGWYEGERDMTQSDANARGTFTFTGLYTAAGAAVARGSGQDFADFLLGLPQQATRQYSVSPDNISSPVVIHGRQFSAYFQDDWRWKARLTIDYGVEYGVFPPYTEASGHMVNLDVAPDFSAAAPVFSGGTGAYEGQFPAGLVDTDLNNVAPRVGAAWRATSRSVVRFGYGLSYNNGTYSAIARQLYQQPPYFLTGTSLGSLTSPLTLTHAFDGLTPTTVTNNYGIDKNYQLGLIHQWSVDYSRDLFRVWNAGATYIGTRGAELDLLRAPNRGPDGLRIPDVQAFTWQSSGGSSNMHGVSLRLQRRQARGVSGSASYTWSKSRDNTTATGGGATVAQDDQDLGAEWSLSNFDRRHQFSGTTRIELPWGKNRRWLANGGRMSALLGDWSLSATVNWLSGTPLTVRCSTCASDVARGTGGTLRADYTGQAVTVVNPTIEEFFNTAAFAIPQPGSFGSSLRNMVIGPGSHLVNAVFTRDISLGGTRNASINVTANNLLNTVNFGTIDTNVNSPTFGQVLSVRGMRTVRVSLRFRF